MKKGTHGIWKVMLFVLIAFAITLPAVAQQTNGIDSLKKDFTIGELSNKWWQWALALDSTHSPLFDTSDCSTGQSGPIWYLGGQFCITGGPCSAGVINRTCTIPADKSILLAVINTDFSFIENQAGLTEHDLRVFTKDTIDQTTELKATLDGHALKLIRVCTSGTECSPVQAPLAPFTLAGQRNLFAEIGETINFDPAQGLIKDGTYSMMITDGFYALIPPMSPGVHLLKFHGTLPQFGFSLDGTYLVNVLHQ